MALIRAARQEKLTSFPRRWILEELVNNNNKNQHSNRHTNKYMKKNLSNVILGSSGSHLYFLDHGLCIKMDKSAVVLE